MPEVVERATWCCRSPIFPIELREVPFPHVCEAHRFTRVLFYCHGHPLYDHNTGRNRCPDPPRADRHGLKRRSAFTRQESSHSRVLRQSSIPHEWPIRGIGVGHLFFKTPSCHCIHGVEMLDTPKMRSTRHACVALSSTSAIMPLARQQLQIGPVHRHTTP
jgi:hypothetical protein